MREGDKSMSAEDPCCRAPWYSTEYKELFTSDQPEVAKEVPDGTFLKVDVVYSEGLNYGGWGVVIQDAAGEVAEWKI